MDDLVTKLRKSAEGTARATQMLADAKSARNQAAEGGDWPSYQGLKPEQTTEWKAADEIERLREKVKILEAEIQLLRKVFEPLTPAG